MKVITLILSLRHSYIESHKESPVILSISLLYTVKVGGVSRKPVAIDCVRLVSYGGIHRLLEPEAQSRRKSRKVVRILL